MKRDELAARIWRTIVFSGAMLASPVAGAEKAPEPSPTKPAPSRPAPPPQPPQTVESLTEQIARLEAWIATEKEAVANAKDDAARRAAQQRLARYQREKTGLEARRATLVLEALQKQLAELNTRIEAAIAAVSAAKSDAELKAAKARLETLKAEQAALNQKIAAARPAKRPRNGDADRPTGRGFVLS